MTQRYDEGLSPDLVKLAATLSQRCVLHINRGRHGHTYGHEITDSKGKIVGRLSVHSLKGKVHRVYTMGDSEFENIGGFLKAYQQEIWDQEWETSAPKLSVPAEERR